MYGDIARLLPEQHIRWNEPMKNHTSFRIGGPADCMVFPSTVSQVLEVVSWCRARGIPYLVIGKGSNLLVRDKGIRGVVIKLGEIFCDLTVTGNMLHAQAGALLSRAARLAAQHGLTGLEFAEGIPGSVGGAVFMNAGAYGGEMKDVVYEVQAMDDQGNLRTMQKPELGFGYRRSVFQDNGFVILAVHMALQPGNTEEIRERMAEFARRREEKQPLEFPSAGSTFKRPEGYFVGPLIEELGLKGLQVGGAQISAKHAGFIINTGNAKAADVLELIRIVQARVRESKGIDLQPEIRIVGED